MSTISYEQTKHIGVIARYGSGWTKEINIISWNGTKPKYDIRDWDETHEHMSTGVMLTEEELHNLTRILNEIVAMQKK